MFIEQFEKTAGPMIDAAKKGVGIATKFIKKNPLKSAALAGGAGLVAGKAMGGSKQVDQPGGQPMLGQ